jgi:hypothetical protein
MRIEAKVQVLYLVTINHEIPIIQLTATQFPHVYFEYE